MNGHPLSCADVAYIEQRTAQVNAALAANDLDGAAALLATIRADGHDDLATELWCTLGHQAIDVLTGRQP